MRILYVGNFSKPFDTEAYVYSTLESLGHEVIRISFERATVESLRFSLSDVDFVLLAKGDFRYGPEAAWETIRASKKLTVGWFWDLIIGTSREWMLKNQPVFKADVLFSTDGGHDNVFREKGFDHHVLRQGIFEPECYIANKTEHKNDIVFVGTSDHMVHFGWGYRQKLLNWLKDTYGDRFGWYGKENEVRNGDLNQLFANSKIVIGDSVASPNYWSNRLYETLGRGAFLIFPMIQGLEKEFEPYKEFVPYSYGDFDGLKEKIDYFLTHDKEREAIKFAGFKRCKKDHTYTKRCEELLCIVNSMKKKS